MTQAEYAEKMGVFGSAIRYRVRWKIFLPGVVKIETIGKGVIFHVPKDFDFEEAKSFFRKKAAV